MTLEVSYIELNDLIATAPENVTPTVAYAEGFVFTNYFDDLADTPSAKVKDGFVKANSTANELEYINPRLTAGDGITVTNPEIKDNPTIEVKTGDSLDTSSGSLDVKAGDGLKVDSLGVSVDDTVVRTTRIVESGGGLSGGGNLSGDRTLSVNVDRGLTIASDNVGINLPSDSGLTTTGGALKIDINNTSEKTTSAGSDVFLLEDSSGLKRITRNNLLASVAGGTEYRGSVNPVSSMPSPITTLTVTGDAENATISQGVEPTTTSPSPNGFTYVVLLDDSDKNTGVTVRMGGASGSPEDFIVFDQDLLQWLGDRFIHLESGDAVISVFDRQGVVTAQAGDYNASQVTNAPAGNVSSNSVQGAINELDTNKGGLSTANTWTGQNTYSSSVGLNATTSFDVAGGAIFLDSDANRHDVFTYRQDGNVRWTEFLDSAGHIDFVSSGAYEFRINGNQVWTAGNDGAGSGLDADTLDGMQASEFADATHSHAISDVTGLQADLDSKLNSTDYTAADVLAKLVTVDGAGSGLNADYLDGLEGSQFIRSDADDNVNGRTRWINRTSIKLPSGTTSQRPTTPEAGEFRFNEEDESCEVFDGTSWGGVGGGGGLPDPTVVTANTTGVVGESYLFNITAPTVLTLPAGVAGDIIYAGDYDKTFSYLNPLSIRSSQKIEGSDDDFHLVNANVKVTLQYIDASIGWKVMDGIGEGGNDAVPYEEVVILPYVVRNAASGTITLPAGYTWSDFEQIEWTLGLNTNITSYGADIIQKEKVAANPTGWLSNVGFQSYTSSNRYSCAITATSATTATWRGNSSAGSHTAFPIVMKGYTKYKPVLNRGVTTLWTGNTTTGGDGKTITFSESASKFDAIVVESRCFGIEVTQHHLNWGDVSNPCLMTLNTGSANTIAWGTSVSDNGCTIKFGSGARDGQEFVRQVYGIKY